MTWHGTPHPELADVVVFDRASAARALALPLPVLREQLSESGVARWWKRAIHEESFIQRCPVRLGPDDRERTSGRYSRAVALAYTEQEFALIAAQCLLSGTIAPSVRRDLVLTLAKRVPGFVMRFMTERWPDDEDEGRWDTFVELLEALDESTSPAALRQWLVHTSRLPSPRVLRAAISAADRLGDEEASALEPFRLHLTGCSPPILRARVAAALARRGDEGASRLLEQLAGSPDSATRLEALRGLRVSHDPTRYFGRFVEALRDTSGWCESCSSNGTLTECGCSWDWSLVNAGLFGLERIGGVAVMNAFLSALDDLRVGVNTLRAIACAAGRLALELDPAPSRVS